VKELERARPKVKRKFVHTKCFGLLGNLLPACQLPKKGGNFKYKFNSHILCAAQGVENAKTEKCQQSAK